MNDLNRTDFPSLYFFVPKLIFLCPSTASLLPHGLFYSHVSLILLWDHLSMIIFMIQQLVNVVKRAAGLLLHGYEPYNSQKFVEHIIS